MVAALSIHPIENNSQLNIGADRAGKSRKMTIVGIA
jgi:hypothetical protein